MWMCVRAEAWESRSRHNTLSRREDVCCARRRSRRYPSCCLSPYFSRRPTRVRPKYRNRSVSKYREEEFTGPRFGCGRRAVRPRRVSLSIARNPSDVARDCALRYSTAGGGELAARGPYRGRGQSSSRAGSSAAPGPDCAERILVGLSVSDVRMHRPVLTGGVPGRAPFPVINVRCAT